MTYLTYDEYKDLAIDPVDESMFEKLYKRAASVIDVATRHFYQWKDFETDHDWRKEAVKMAITYQIEFFEEVGATTYEGMNKAPQSFSAGRTSVSNSSSYRAGDTNEKKSLLSLEAQNELLGTGLLYRGVR